MTYCLQVMIKIIEKIPKQIYAKHLKWKTYMNSSIFWVLSFLGQKKELWCIKKVCSWTNIWNWSECSKTYSHTYGYNHKVYYKRVWSTYQKWSRHKRWDASWSGCLLKTSRIITILNCDYVWYMLLCLDLKSI